jgi:hypothetical protein
MTKDEALDLALEALESCGAGHITDGGNQWHDEKLVDKAITAIKQARSAPVQKPYRPLQDNGSQYFGDSWDTPPAQPAPVQEPVVTKNGEGMLLHSNWYSLPDGTKLYTTPPTQEFVCSTGLCHYKATSDERLMLEDAVLAEREACAKVCDQFIDEMQKVLPVEKLRETDPYKAFYKANAARIIQDTIRARGQA